MGETDTDTDLDVDMNYNNDLDPYTETNNMPMMDMAALVDRSIETHRATIDFDYFHKHNDHHLNFSNRYTCVHLQAS